MSKPCPSCGTHFAEGEEPWLQQNLHCPIHDRVYKGECEFCTPEQRAAVALARQKQQHDAANESRVASGQEPLPWKEVASVDSGDSSGAVSSESEQGDGSDADKHSSSAASK